ETRVDRPQRLVTDAPVLHGAGRIRLDENIGPADQIEQHFTPALGVQVDSQTELSGIEMGEHHAALGSVVHAHVPAAGTAAVEPHRSFNLHDGGPEIGQAPRRQGAGVHTREVDTVDTVERKPSGRSARGRGRTELSLRSRSGGEGETALAKGWR